MVREPIFKKKYYENNNYSCSKNVTIMDGETGELFCENCGVIQGMILQNNMGEIFPNSDFSSHAGNKTSLRLYDMGLSTFVGKFNHDCTGKSFDYKMKPLIHRMRLWDSRSKIKQSSERNLRTALLEIDKLREKLSLTDLVLERSAYLYRKSAKTNLVRGRSIKGMVGACVYIACRELDISRTIKDIAENLQEDRKSIARNYRFLFQNLSLTVTVSDPLKRIVKFSNNLRLSESTKREAIRIFDKLQELGVTAGKNPDGVASTIIYMASIKTCEHISQQQISKISGITAVTIRNRCKEFRKYINLI